MPSNGSKVVKRGVQIKTKRKKRKPRCELGEKCPYQHEYQHSLEYDHGPANTTLERWDVRFWIIFSLLRISQTLALLTLMSLALHPPDRVRHRHHLHSEHFRGSDVPYHLKSVLRRAEIYLNRTELTEVKLLLLLRWDVLLPQLQVLEVLRIHPPLSLFAKVIQIGTLVLQVPALLIKALELDGKWWFILMKVMKRMKCSRREH